MKKTFHLISFLFTCLLLFNTIVIINVSAAGLQVTFTTNPIIVSPGTNGYLEINLKSVGGATSYIDISASSRDHNVIIPQGNWDVYVGSLNNGESCSFIYEYRVSNTASPGLYQVVFEIEYTEGNTIRQTAIIQVEDVTVLDVTSVTPSSIKIGEATTLVFNITNNCLSNINNVIFIWEDPNDLILPLGADNRIIIPSIAAKNYTELPIVVMASSGISPGVYALTITMDFYDQTGTEQIITSTFGIQISGTTTFDVVLQTSTSSSTTFAVVNTGANTASSVIVSIPQQAGYSTSGTSSASLGNLEAGDYTLASFQLTSMSSNMTNQFPSFNRTGMDIPSNRDFGQARDMFMNQSFSGMGGNQLLVQISYTDVFGVRQTVQKQVNIASGSTSGFSSRASGTYTRGFSGQSQSSSGSGNSLMYIAIGVAGIIIIATIIRLGRKKKLGRFSKFFKGRKE
jgi:hypothetical protein